MAIIAPQPGRQSLAMNIQADVIIFGGAAGAGKSRLLLMRPLLHMDDPNFTGVIFRRTQEALKKGGSVWPESKKLYRPLNTHVNNKDRKHTFKSGAVLAFDGLKDVGDEERNYQGSQFSFIGFDEGTHFEEQQVIYMISRLRSDAENDAYCMITCNPLPQTWLLKWVQPYLDEGGYPIREKGGLIRYFLTINNQPIFSDTKEWLEENYPDRAFVPDGEGGLKSVVMSYTFIDGNIFDNPELMRNEPKYLAKLRGQSRVNQARLIDGCWYAREEATGYFKREWVKNKKPPLEVIRCRAYDKAAMEPSEERPYPDYTACVLLSKDKHGFYYIQGNYHEEFKDPGSNVYGRFRKRPGERDSLIIKQAKQDGIDTKVVFAIDPGQAGQVEFQESAKKLVQERFVVKADPMPNNKNKVTRFSPFASACENGLVFIDEESFGNKDTLETYLSELESFNGDRSTSGYKDDYTDSSASAFNYLASAQVIKIVRRNQAQTKTISNEFLQEFPTPTR
jgi:predicted phage terminase large subunit-like protein